MNFDIARHSFTLPDSFLKRFKNKQPDWGPLGYFTYKRTYARNIEGEDRTEEYWETCRRVVEGCFSIQKNHCSRVHLPWDERKAQRTAKRMFELMWDFKFLPPGRGMWAMGTKYVEERGGAALNNCGFTSTKDLDVDPITPFTFLMDMSMVGVGVGFDTKGSNKAEVHSPNALSNDTYVIPDSREGWVDALRILLSAYLIEGESLPKFDFSEIREAGEPIRGFGGTASGPEPLRLMLQEIEEVLKNRVGGFLTSVDITDIQNLIGKCVVAGNVRRSAEIAFGDPDDVGFSLMKQDKEKLMNHRWASNNSILAEVGMDYSWHAEQTAVNGEPGYMWLENARAYGRMCDMPNWLDRDAHGGNPCLEQTLFHLELCNLVETFPARHDSLEEFIDTLKIAYLYAKTVTLVPTHWPETNAVISKNRRIGLSQSGIIKAFGRHGRRELIRWCDKGYEFINGLDIQYSNWLGVPRSIKKTSVKPSGTISLLPGEPPGIHYPHSQFYIRRIRVGIHSNLWRIAERAGYKVEPDVTQKESTMVVEFPVREDFFRKGKDEVSIWEQVSNAVVYQKYWADNQVSITVSFNKDEANDIKHALELNEDSLKGISFLPLSDHGYQQAPYETITEEQYLEMTKDIKPIEFGTMQEDAVAPRFCDGDQCEL